MKTQPFLGSFPLLHFLSSILIESGILQSYGGRGRELVKEIQQGFLQKTNCIGESYCNSSQQSLSPIQREAKHRRHIRVRIQFHSFRICPVIFYNHPALFFQDFTDQTD